MTVKVLRGSRGRACVGGLALLLTSLASAESVPVPGATDPRVRTAQYSAEQVYRLEGFVGYGIELIFEEGERFTGQAGGDLEAITFGAHEHQLMLKPRAANVGTNFVIYTNRRVYRFDYSVSAEAPDPLSDEVVYAVRFIYPATLEKSGPTLAEQVDSELARARVARTRNYDYWFCGHPAVKPIAASDDGVHTRLAFGSKAELPAMFVRNADGTESLLNFSIEEGEIIIHRVAPELIVRRGRLTGCIVNKGFVGSGERLESGTIAPEVWRERKEAKP